MTSETKIVVVVGLAKFMCLFVVIGIMLSFIYSVFFDEHGWLQRTKRQNAAVDMRQAAYKARLPEAGDKVVLNGTMVSVIKHYFWSSKILVRYPDGRMADVAEKEMLDLKKPPEVIKI